MIEVHITDDHKMLIQGLTASINESNIATVTGYSCSLEACRKALSAQAPDVLLLDLNLSDGSGIDFCSEVHEKYPEIKILVLTTHDEYSIAKRVLENGASGYILKNSLSEEVVEGIQAVMNGEIFLCEEIDILIKKRTDKPIWLTTRERELVTLVAGGYTNQEIADTLFLGVETIKTYRKNLLLKFSAKNSIVMINMAKEQGLIT